VSVSTPLPLRETYDEPAVMTSSHGQCAGGKETLFQSSALWSRRMNVETIIGLCLRRGSRSRAMQGCPGSTFVDKRSRLQRLPDAHFSVEGTMKGGHGKDRLGRQCIVVLGTNSAFLAMVVGRRRQRPLPALLSSVTAPEAQSPQRPVPPAGSLAAS
jgi:hypothetical protein